MKFNQLPCMLAKAMSTVMAVPHPLQNYIIFCNFPKRNCNCPHFAPFAFHMKNKLLLLLLLLYLSKGNQLYSYRLCLLNSLKTTQEIRWSLIASIQCYMCSVWCIPYISCAQDMSTATSWTRETGGEMGNSYRLHVHTSQNVVQWQYDGKEIDHNF